MVLREQALEHLASSGIADSITEPIVLRECLDIVEVMLKIEIVPALGITDREIKLNMQTAQFKESVEASNDSMVILLRNLCNHLGQPVTRMK